MMHFKSLARSPEVFLCQHFLFLAVFILLQESFDGFVEVAFKEAHFAGAVYMNSH